MREAVEEANSPERLKEIRATSERQMSELTARLSAAFKTNNLDDAKQATIRMIYIVNLQIELVKKLAAE